MAVPIAAAGAALRTLAARVAQSETARTIATEAGTKIATAAADNVPQKVLQRLGGDGPSVRGPHAGAEDMPMRPRGNKLSTLSARAAEPSDADTVPRGPRA